MTGERLFDGDDIRVVDLTRPGDDGTLVVTFPPSSPRLSLDGEGFGARFLAAQGISAVVFTAAWSHWFQTEECDAALEAIRPVAARFRRVVTYGSSMGGYAAAAASSALGADAIIAISPQFSVDERKAPWDRRYQTWAARIRKGAGFCRDNMANLIRPEAELHLAYDPLLRGDRLHAEALLAHSANPQPLVMPLSGHPTGLLLQQGSELKFWVLGIVRGRPDVGVRMRFRARRRRIPLWWARLARNAADRRPALGLAAARRARALAPADPSVAFLASVPLFRGGAREEGLAAAEAACMAKPRNAKYRLHRARLLMLAGQPARALAEYEAALLHARDRAAALAGMAEAKAVLGDTEAARRLLAEAEELGAGADLRKRAERLLRSAGSKEGGAAALALEIAEANTGDEAEEEDA
ncbi:hypothetical protein J8J14_16740 [Roseomonas sp. SSH11]|uniref:Alpha/beta hydrolase n=1 Tax=Pararoseomonas baculiformis TaxID=2820812 RepID=A0ABS4AJN4_9PROT|nr:hypothetical protein [Pararoseomonas baculiformis]MBP0446424.1 hypothetical protein [Pararoseomonas baculiformis]